MNKEVVFNDSIDKLEISGELLVNLFNNGICLIKDLWNLSRKDLKKMNFSDGDINQIMIKMQLHGIDLNRKIYNKN